jgi:FdhE protein
LYGRMRIGDPTRDIVGQPVPIILPDPATLFPRRAERLEVLAEGHPMADWLRFMARLARAQHAALAALSAPEHLAVTEGEPPLALVAHPGWHPGLDVLLREVDDVSLPDQARGAIRTLRARNAVERDALADACLHGGLKPDMAGEAMFIAAALSSYWMHRASALPELHLLPQRGRCPACGSTPVSGIVTAAGRTPGVRYLHCGLCATAWNHVRAVCTHCGGSRSVSLLGIEGGDGVVQAETCGECQTYAKMLYQAKDMAVEAMADDLASLGLDMLVGEAGYRRAAANPLVIGAE